MSGLMKLKLELAIDGDKAVVTGLNRVSDSAKGVSQSTGRMGAESDKAGAGMGRMASQGGALASVMRTLGPMLAGFSFAAMAREMIRVNTEFDRLQASLVTVTGSASLAKKEFEKIQDFAKTTPYQLTEVTDAFIKMKSLGLDASQEALNSYGNTASAMGKSLNQMIEAVADAATGEFERLKEFGIKARQQGDQVSLTFQGVTTTIGNNAGEIEGYLRQIGDVQFAGGMARQMETLGGAISNLRDQWDQFIRALGDGGGEAAIRGVTESLSRLTNTLALYDAYSKGQLSFWEFLTTGPDEAIALLKNTDFELKGLQITVDELKRQKAGNFWWTSNDEAALQAAIDALDSYNRNLEATKELQAALATNEMANMPPLPPGFGEAVVKTKKELKELNDALQAVAEETANMPPLPPGYAESMAAAATQAERWRTESEQAQKAAKTMADSLEAIKRLIDPAYAAMEDFYGQVQTLMDALSAGEINLDQFDAMYAALEKIRDAATDAAERTADYIKKQKEATQGTATISEAFTVAWESAVGRIDGLFVNLWESVFSGFDDLVDGIKNTFKRMLAEMANAAITRPILLSMGLMGGSAGVASAAGGGGLLGAGSLLGLGGLAALGSSFSFGLTSGAGFATSAGLIAAPGALGASGVAAGMGGLIAAAAPYAAAIAAPFLIDSLSGGKLFGTSWRTDATGLELGASGSGVSGQWYAGQSKQKSFYRGKKRRTEYSAFDEVTAEFIDQQFNAVTQNILNGTEMLGNAMGESILSSLDIATTKIKLPKNATSSDVQNAISGFMRDASNQALAEAFRNGSYFVDETTTTTKRVEVEANNGPRWAYLRESVTTTTEVFTTALDDYRRAGEDLTATFNRLQTNLSIGNAGLKLLGMTMFDASLFGADLAQSLIESSGGIEAFAASVEGFYSMFAPEAQRVADVSTALSESLAAVGLAVPATRDGFWELMQSLDATTASGQAKIATLLRLTDTADAYYSATEKAAAEQARIAEQAAADIIAAENALAAERERIAGERYGLETQLLQLQGDTAALRERELASIDPSNQALQQYIWSIEDSQAAAEQAAAAEQTLAAERAQIAQEAYGLQTRILQLQGDTAALRARELEQLAEENRPLQEKIWGLEAAQAAAAAAEQARAEQQRAAEQAAAAQQRAHDAARNAATQTANAWKDAANSIRDTIMGLWSGAESTLSPAQKLALAQSQYQTALAGARGGNLDAAKALGGYATDYASAARANAGSASDYARIFATITSGLASVADKIDPRGRLPMFAGGGITTGLSLAGEAGPEAVVPLPDGRRIPVQLSGADAETKALLRELIRLQKAAVNETVKASKRLVEINEDWDANGLPETRVA
jgi:hypothetical protein